MSAGRRQRWGGRRPGAGRPELPAKERQNAALLLRLRPGELDALRERAAASGLSVGVYAREVLRRHIRRTLR